jgi:subtilisin family serine protease/pimeloyl-ACP methyl ester carboxylesterase
MATRSKAPRPRRRRPTRTSARPSKRALDVPAALGLDDNAQTIVYVHGIGNKPIESILKCQWDHALFGFDAGARTRLAYWVNREYYPIPNEATCGSGDKVEVEEGPTGRALSVAAHLAQTSLEEEAAALTTNRVQRETLVRLARVIDQEQAVPPRGPRATGVQGYILPLPPALRRWITRKLTRAFMRDVHDYLFVPGRRALMRQSVLERLQPGGGPFVVVGHSQGSMIAFDVLSELDPDKFQVPLFVTIGSPLGIAEVQDQLKVLLGKRKLTVPRCVWRWFNVCDPSDPVAADETLGDDYTGGSVLEDLRATNLDSPAHPHSGTGYLRIEAVRRAVRDAVRVDLFQPVAPFVIARNLVRRLENAPRETRHPVLMELLEASGPAKPLEEVSDKLVAEIRRISKRSEDELRIQRMRRFLGADLTRQETEHLASQFGMRGLMVKRIWRNEAKRALLDTSIATIHAGAAHAGYQAFGRGIAWAVLDSGINSAHPHFARYTNIVSEVDCTKRTVTEGSAPDLNGHGTHVAGIMAGVHEFPGTPPRVFSGVAPQTALHIYKVLDADGNGEDAWIIKALDHIASVNDKAGTLVIHGVNLSLGGPFDQSTYGCGHTPLCEELRRLWRQGVLVVLAAGNEGFAVLRTLEGDIDANMDLSIGDPANLEEAIAVGSVHKQNPHTYGVSYFSSRGPTADGRQKPDVVAPGERILSCRYRYPSKATSVDDLYIAMSGTSMAAPHVSGALAAFLSARREFIGETERVKAHLLANCTDLGREKPHQGAGLPNLVKMLVNV